MSSWVAAGHVGLSAATPVLQAMACETVQLPTTVLSNHNAWPHVAGRATAPEHLLEMLDAIDANGWLAGVDAVLTGYFPSAAHVDVACAVVDRVRRATPAAMIVCDPVLGDDPKGLYVKAEVAAAIRDELAPRADVLTPNLFELGWLAGRSVETIKTVADAVDAADALRSDRPERRIVVTSAPIDDETTGVVDARGGGALVYRTQRRDRVPNGVGDAFAAMIAGGDAVGDALGRLDALIAFSIGAPHLAIIDPRWRNAAPIAGVPASPKLGGR